MGDDFAVIREALNRLATEKENAWTEYVELVKEMTNMGFEIDLLRKIAAAGEVVVKQVYGLQSITDLKNSITDYQAWKEGKK